MKSLTDNQVPGLDRLLLETGRLLEDLCRLEEKIQQQVVNGDPRGLSAAVQSSTEILCRGDKLIEQKQQLALQNTTQEFIAWQTEDEPLYSRQVGWESLTGKLAEVKAWQEVNRCLLESGLQLALKLQEIGPAGDSTYDCCGEIRPSVRSDRPSRLNRNC